MKNNNFNRADNPAGLFYEVHGSGSPVLFLHGLGGTSYTWHKLVPALSSRHKLFLLDMKGFGHSIKTRDDRYSVHDQADLVCRFIINHELHDVTLVGNSFGGSVALVTALRLMEKERGRLSSLILVDAAAYRQPLPGFLRLLRMPIVGAIMQRLLPLKSQVKSVLEFAYYDKRKISASSIDVYAAALRLPGARYAAQQTARQIIPPDIDELELKYKTIRVPTLILWGRHDRVVPLWVGEKLNREIPNSRLKVIENAGHMPQEETPEEVIPLIEDFLR